MQEVLQENSDQPVDELKKLIKAFREYLASLSGRDVIDMGEILKNIGNLLEDLEEIKKHNKSAISCKQDKIRRAVYKRSGVYGRTIYR